MALEPAVLRNVETGTEVTVLFNPTEYSLSKDNNFAQAAVHGLSSPVLQFANGSVQTLKLELFVDSLERHDRVGTSLNPAQADVRRYTEPVMNLMTVNPETHAPPRVEFVWGGLDFCGVLARVQQQFVMFLESGVPVRARLRVSFQEWVDPLNEAKQIKRQTADFTRLQQVAEGDTLAQLAARRYGDAARWRPIAIANQLEDPRRLPAGLELRIPPLPFRDPATGEVHR
jgi:hypothetical protein